MLVLETQILIYQLDNQVDRIDALLSQSEIYTSLELHDEANAAYDEAASIARETLDDSESRVLAEIALAEHHLRQDDQEAARHCYKIAKENATNLPLIADLNSAYMYVARSEASYGLTEDAKATNNKITDIELRESSTAQIQMLADEGQARQKPVLAAGHEQKGSGTYDNSEISDISELVEMAEQNRKKFKAAKDKVWRELPRTLQKRRIFLMGQIKILLMIELNSVVRIRPTVRRLEVI